MLVEEAEGASSEETTVVSALVRGLYLLFFAAVLVSGVHDPTLSARPGGANAEKHA